MVWSSILQGVVNEFVGKVPVIGGLINVIVNAFWPSSGPDIWAMIKDEVQALVDAAILRAQIEARQSDLQALQRNMKSYADATLISEKGNMLTGLLQDAVKIQEHLIPINQSNRKHYIALVVAHSALHLSLLRERVLFGDVLYPARANAVWENELLENFGRYTRYFNEALKEWESWRASRIEEQLWDQMTGLLIWTAFGQVLDHETGRKEPTDPLRHQVNTNPTYWRIATSLIKERLVNGFRAEFVRDVISPSFSLLKYIPSREKEDDLAHSVELGTLRFGPYPWSLTFNQNSTMAHDTLGTITSIEIRHGALIDFLRATFEGGRLGVGVGNTGGGNAANLPVVFTNPIHGVRIGIRGEVVSIRFTNKSGATNTYGGNDNNMQPSIYWDTGNFPGFDLSGFGQERGSSSGYVGMRRMMFYFQHHSIRQARVSLASRAPFIAAVSLKQHPEEFLHVDTAHTTARLLHESKTLFYLDPIDSDLWAIRVAESNDTYLDVSGENPSVVGWRYHEGDSSSIADSGKFKIEQTNPGASDPIFKITPHAHPASHVSFDGDVKAGKLHSVSGEHDSSLWSLIPEVGL